MTIAVAITVVLAAFYFTLRIRPKDVPEPIPASPIQHLEDRKRAIYDNLRDLQFEYRLGKLSDSDYQQNKLALQRELAVVLAAIQETIARLGLVPAARGSLRPPKPVKNPPAERFACPHCNATFPQALKYCGECGKAMLS